MNVLSSVRSATIGDVAAVNPKGPAPGEIESDDLLDFLPMAAVSEDGTMAVSSQRPYSDVSKGYTAFRNGDVLLAKITPCFENNKIALADVRTDWAFGSTEFHVIRPECDVDPRYLLHFLRQDTIRVAGEKRMMGSGGQRRVPKAFLEELPIPLPPLPEQKRIAAILDQADALRRLRRRALDRLNTLGQAIFQEMFGDFRTDTGDWPVVRLEEVVESAKIGLVRGASELSANGGTPYLRMDAIQGGRLNLGDLRRTEITDGERSAYSLVPGDLLFNTRNSRELVGKSAVLRESFSGVYNNNILRLRMSSRASSSFIDAFFRTNVGAAALEARKSGTTSVFAIYQKSLMDVPVPMPPINMQRRFEHATMRLAEQLATLQGSAANFETLFTSLQHRAFTGQL